ncbi:hypothetical protein HY642_04115 [Candidatus Woesearchaeota archaeon]|nr:hypothetical protein [Candidatus Woesearchaeota archaeon]
MDKSLESKTKELIESLDLHTVSYVQREESFSEPGYDKYEIDCIDSGTRIVHIPVDGRGEPVNIHAAEYARNTVYHEAECLGAPALPLLYCAMKCNPGSTSAGLLLSRVLATLAHYQALPEYALALKRQYDEIVRFDPHEDACGISDDQNAEYNAVRAYLEPIINHSMDERPFQANYDAIVVAAAIGCEQALQHVMRWFEPHVAAFGFGSFEPLIKVYFRTSKEAVKEQIAEACANKLRAVGIQMDMHDERMRCLWEMIRGSTHERNAYESYADLLLRAVRAPAIDLAPLGTTQLRQVVTSFPLFDGLPPELRYNVLLSAVRSALPWPRDEAYERARISSALESIISSHGQLRSEEDARSFVESIKSWKDCHWSKRSSSLVRAYEKLLCAYGHCAARPAFKCFTDVLDYTGIDDRHFILSTCLNILGETADSSDVEVIDCLKEQGAWWRWRSIGPPECDGEIRKRCRIVAKQLKRKVPVEYTRPAQA